MEELKAAADAVRHGAPSIIDLCSLIFKGALPGGLKIPSGCTIRNGSMLLSEGTQVGVTIEMRKMEKDEIQILVEQYNSCSILQCQQG